MDTSGTVLLSLGGNVYSHCLVSIGEHSESASSTSAEMKKIFQLQTDLFEIQLKNCIK